jgi:septal ring factor EnvC (AmiA/AmiB activator)
MLNQENPAMLGRMLAYHGYFGRARAAQIQSIQADDARLQTMDHELQEQGAQLDQLGEQARTALQSLEQARAQRVAALNALNQRVEGAHQQIERMQREEQALDALLADLNRVLPDFALGPQKPFAQMRGQLPWPVAGRIEARFHASRGGTMRWNGMLINASRSAKVRAPYYGRVVYADWLQGMGLLMIIEHGGGFMSLYGHAEVLYKRVGDNVAPGDVIAAMSAADSPQLYLEIRRARTAVDPQQWLKPLR